MQRPRSEDFVRYDGAVAVVVPPDELVFDLGWRASGHPRRIDRRGSGALSGLHPVRRGNAVPDRKVGVDVDQAGVGEARRSGTAAVCFVRKVQFGEFREGRSGPVHPDHRDGTCTGRQGVCP